MGGALCPSLQEGIGMSKEVTLSSGAVVRLNAVSPMLVLAVNNSIPEPKVPIFRNEEKQRDEPNELDPEYIAAVQKRQLDLTRLTTEAYVANGVTVLSIPPNKSELSSDDWIEGLELVGIEVRKSGKGRFVDWIQYHLLEDANDLTELLTGVAVTGGLVSEADVEAAAESFRPNTNGQATAEVPTETTLRFGDTPSNISPWPSD